MVTREQAQMLTALAVAARPNGAAKWDAAGVMAEIGKVKDRTLADVILAVIRAADDREAKTPGVISAKGSKHWQERGQRTASPEPFDKGGCCNTCSLPYAKCRAIWRDDHDYISVAEYAKTVTKDPGTIARILQAIKGEVPPMREPKHIPPPEERAPDHSECEPAMQEALAHGKPGRAEFIAHRCDRAHGHLPATETHDPQPETARTDEEQP